MYHSLIINGYNTWDDWGLVPETRPLIVPAKVKTNYIDVPGANGSLDYTEFLSGVHYENREGTWDFIVHNDKTNGQTWAERYHLITQKIHGQHCRILMEDEPGWFYEGRLYIEDWNSDQHWSKIKIGYSLEPYRHPTGSSQTSELDWLWNDLFNNIIYYGTFDVVGEPKERNLINPSADLVQITATCSSEMTVEFEGQTITLPQGTSFGLITLSSGNNVMTFNGSGRVVIDYRLGDTL